MVACHWPSLISLALWALILKSTYDHKLEAMGLHRCKIEPNLACSTLIPSDDVWETKNPGWKEPGLSLQGWKWRNKIFFTYKLGHFLSKPLRDNTQGTARCHSATQYHLILGPHFNIFLACQCQITVCIALMGHGVGCESHSTNKALSIVDILNYSTWIVLHKENIYSGLNCALSHTKTTLLISGALFSSHRKWMTPSDFSGKCWCSAPLKIWPPVQVPKSGFGCLTSGTRFWNVWW